MTVDAVRIQTSIAQPFVVAGSPFSLTTKITNLHDEEVEIIEYLYHIPYQVQWIHDENYDKAYETYKSRPWIQRFFVPYPWRQASQPPGQVMSFKNLQEEDQSIQTILPGQATSYSFKALVPKWLFVSGGQLTFQGRIRYRTSRGIHTSPFEITLTLRPPLVSNCLGACIGALLGSIAKGLQEQGATFFPGVGLEYIAATVLAVILSVVAVIYSSRRTGESQPILTVEDFWGGMIVGFLMGYLGHDFFAKVVPIQ